MELSTLLSFRTPTWEIVGPKHKTQDSKSLIGDLIVASEVYGPQQDAATLEVMRSVLDQEKPDFVVINGDIIQGDDLVLENATDYMDMVVQPMLERDLPWGSTYGNHDYQYNITGKTILETEQKYINSRTRSMVKNKEAGETNYWLPVYPADCQDCKKCVPELLLWFFDSRGGVRFQEKDENGEKVSPWNGADAFSRSLCTDIEHRSTSQAGSMRTWCPGSPRPSLASQHATRRLFPRSALFICR